MERPRVSDRETIGRAPIPPLERRARAPGIVGELAAVIAGAARGMSLESAAARARVTQGQLKAWLSLAADGVEPFAAWATEVRAHAAQAQYDVLGALRAMASVDARAAATFLERCERHTVPEPKPSMAWGRALGVRKAELARAAGLDSRAVRALVAPAEPPPLPPIRGATGATFGRLEPVK